MPTLKPFKGIRYADTDAMAQLICPPYDIISPSEQAELHHRHGHNAVRLELAQRSGAGDDRYAAVRDLFTTWLESGVLATDQKDSLYVYRQDFTAADGSRRRVAGVIGALELEEFGHDAGVLPHERTMQGPKEDRLALLRAVELNVSPIYAIYRGGGGLAPFLDALENRPTTVRVQDEQGILHRLWVINAPAELEMLSDAISPGPLVIADGHHRYETALAFHREQAAKSIEGDHDSIMCFCVDADSEELVVLPYNRAVKTTTSTATVVERLRSGFAAEPADLEEADSLLGSDGADHSYLFVFSEGSYLARLSDAEVVAEVGERHPAWRSLDVVGLHEVLLKRVLDEDSPGLTFSKDPQEILGLVRDGSHDFGVLLRALRASEIVDVATSGERMPQKASYFWPKAITGLVFHSLR
ncbi:MAG: DUF1015 family protein [Actinomycetota bacterium]